MTTGHVLIVLAADTTLELPRAYFVSASFAISTARSYDDALHEARQSLPQAMIIDLDIPTLASPRCAKKFVRLHVPNISTSRCLRRVRKWRSNRDRTMIFWVRRAAIISA